MGAGTRRLVLAEGRFLRLVEEDGWEFVERPNISGIAVIVAVTPDRRLLLVEQFRPAVRGWVIELPAGLAGDRAEHAAEPVDAAARRELIEETGYQAAGWELLFSGPPSVGVTSEVVTFFRATDLRRIGPGGGDGSEAIRLHEIPLESVSAFLVERSREGRWIDPKVYAGLYWAFHAEAPVGRSAIEP